MPKAVALRHPSLAVRTPSGSVLFVSQGRRVLPLNASRRYPEEYWPAAVPAYPYADPLAEVYDPVDALGVEDRRTFWPEEFPTSWEPARNLSGSSARLSYPARRASGRGSVGARGMRAPLFSPVVAFRSPDRVLVCVRRHARREVIHALGLAGRPGRGRKPRRNVYSNISCR